MRSFVLMNVQDSGAHEMHFCYANTLFFTRFWQTLHNDVCSEWKKKKMRFVFSITTELSFTRNRLFPYAADQCSFVFVPHSLLTKKPHTERNDLVTCLAASLETAPSSICINQSGIIVVRTVLTVLVISKSHIREVLVIQGRTTKSQIRQSDLSPRCPLVTWNIFFFRHI